MEGLCNTAACTRCKDNPRLPGQRWCRQCLTTAQRQRRAESHTAQAAAASAPVTHAEPQAMPRVTQRATQVDAASPPVTHTPQRATAPAPPALSPEAAHVLQRYRETAARVAYFRTLDAQGWRRWPSPDVVYDPLVRELATLRQQLVQLGIDLERRAQERSNDGPHPPGQP